MFNRAFDCCDAPDAARLERLAAALPAPVARLLADEQAAGNTVLAIESGHPAPPVGVCVRLARAISTSDRSDAAALAARGLAFRSWQQGGPQDDGSEGFVEGWSDAKGHCWLLAPTPPGTAAAPAAPLAKAPAPEPAGARELTPDEVYRRDNAWRMLPSAALRAWDASRNITCERWREGEGYDLDALTGMTEAERDSVELALVHSVNGWREVQALAFMDTPRARKALRRVIAEGSPELRMAVLRHAPDLADEATRTEVLVQALAEARHFHGLSEALGVIETFHPPEVVDALWRALAEREGEVAVHVGAMLAWLHGVAAEPFDWAHRPFFLRLRTESRSERAAVIAELRERIARCAASRQP